MGVSVFEGEVLRQTVGVANQNKIEPAALLAVVEVESAGKSLEQDGKTPCLLFERHVFYRELTKKNKLTARARAVAAGLANESWQPSTQYKDQGTSAKRLDLLRRAREIDDECALLSCSWGVGQTMGFNGIEMGFKSARAMFDYMVAGGVPAQVDCMVREIKRKNLVGKLNAHNWPAFAYSYNGSGYKENRYDSKMAAAYQKWKNVELPKMTESSPPPKPVVVSTATPKPTGPSVSQPASPTAKTSGGIGAGIAAFFAAVWAMIQNPSHQIIGLVVLLIILGVITFLVMQYRKIKKEKMIPLGTLSVADTEQVAPGVGV